MAKAPAKSKAAAGDKPAATPAAHEATNQSQAASEASASAGPPQVVAGSEGGVGAGAPAPAPEPGAPSVEGAPGDDTQSALSTEAPPADTAAGGQGADAITGAMPRLFAGDVEARINGPFGHTAFARGAFGDLDEAIAYVAACDAALVAAIGDLVDLALGGSAVDRERASRAIAQLQIIFHAGVSTLRRLGETEGEAADEAVEVRSRDGKPFRRAGFVFGDAWTRIVPTADQLAAIQADRGLQTRTPR